MRANLLGKIFYRRHCPHSGKAEINSWINVYKYYLCEAAILAHHQLPQQHPNHPQPKPSSVQSAAQCANHESDSTATNERAKI